MAHRPQPSKPSLHPPPPVSARSRLRSSSDPFTDLKLYPKSSSNRQQIPAPPPKSAGHSKMPSATTPSRAHRDNVVEAVRDTVTVRHSESSPRTRMGRSQTAVPSSPPSRPPTAGRRSQSQDSVVRAALALEKAKTANKTRAAKKGSMHADVIDRLDFSGVGPMFHHDGPFDACAPSRNRHRTKAPMLAWSGPHSAEPVQASNSDSPYAAASAAFRDPYPVLYEPPKKKHDAIAEAWGIHEPEPFEDFSAGGGSSRIDGDTPASSIYNGKDGRATPNSRNGHTHGRRMDPREMRDVYRDYLDEGQQTVPARRAKRTPLPPPQPIFVGDAQLDSPELTPPAVSPPVSPGLPTRSKSLMQRIRNMRDSPNVPVENGDYTPPSPGSAENAAPVVQQQPMRPTHRQQHSFLGRFGGGPRKDNLSPTSENSENFVYVDEARKEKDLPATPGNAMRYTPSAENGYFDDTTVLASSANANGGLTLGRKTSLMKKVRGVVRGNKA